MARSFSAQDVIALPHLSAHATSTLIQQLCAQAKGEKLGGDLKEALDDLTAAEKVLDTALAQKPAPTTNPAAVTADLEVDRAWGATYDWLSAWARLSGTKEGKTAQALVAALFADGVGFIRLAYLAEYSESAQRLDLIEKDKLASDFKALGGAPFLAMLKATHAAYGKALGVTEAKKTPAAPSASVRDALDEVNAALREYVAKVAASVSRKKPKSAELAANLLDPLTRAASAKRAVVADPTTPPPPEPAPPAATPST